MKTGTQTNANPKTRVRLDAIIKKINRLERRILGISARRKETEVVTVYEVAPGESYTCYYCKQYITNDEALYTRGQVYLCGPDHAPYDANAHYICAGHLDKGVVIYDPYTEENSK